MTTDIRLATDSDVQSINEIYNWYVPRSTCTYQEELEPIESRRAWFVAHQREPRQPVTVTTINGEVIGWGSLSGYRARSAYRFTCENSVYVRHDLHGRGVGSTILRDLIERAKRLDYHTIIAGIDGEQTASVALHASHGFGECGRQKQVGFKFGRWLDVVFMQLMLS